jgi:hypothetical protein
MKLYLLCPFSWKMVLAVLVANICLLFSPHFIFHVVIVVVTNWFLFFVWIYNCDFVTSYRDSAGDLLNDGEVTSLKLFSKELIFGLIYFGSIFVLTHFPTKIIIAIYLIVYLYLESLKTYTQEDPKIAEQNRLQKRAKYLEERAKKLRIDWLEKELEELEESRKKQAENLQNQLKSNTSSPLSTKAIEDYKRGKLPGLFQDHNIDWLKVARSEIQKDPPLLPDVPTKNTTQRRTKTTSLADDLDASFARYFKENPVRVVTPKKYKNPWVSKLMNSQDFTSWKTVINGELYEDNIRLTKFEDKTGKIQPYWVQDFFLYIIKQASLTIQDYLWQMKEDSFFLIAATGLGKTVVSPVYLLFVQMLLVGERSHVDTRGKFVIPTIYVVVPKIPIAIDEAEHLNQTWTEFVKDRKDTYEYPDAFVQPKELPKELFGYKTGLASQNHHAPIQFITTGVLPLLIRNGELRSGVDRVVIDEAHKTLESDEMLEISLSQLWQQKVTVDYMTATVDTNNIEQALRTKIINADKVRFKNYLFQTGVPMRECIVDVIENTLVKNELRRQYDSTYFPDALQMSLSFRESILKAVATVDQTTKVKTRSSGLLICVNSFEGKVSDAEEIKKIISGICKENRIEILLLSSKIKRNPKQFAAYQSAYDQARKEKRNFVIIATNVIEMGVTFADLDFVVTMDTEIDNLDVFGTQKPQCIPLSVAGLKQRAGRVGRKWPGCVYITAEELPENQTLPYYRELSVAELNDDISLRPEAITFPLEHQTPTQFAYMCWLLGLDSAGKISSLLRYLHPPTLAKNQNSSYMVSMTLDLTTKYEKLYTALGIDREKDGTLLGYTQKYLSHPGYPFILMGVKSLLESFQVFDSFVAYQYLAILSQYSCKDVMDNEYSHISFSPSLTVDNGREKKYYGRQIRTLSSDLIILGYKMTDIYVWTEKFDIKTKFDERSPGRVSTVSDNGLKYDQVARIMVEIQTHIDGLMAHLRKSGYHNQDFDDYINKGWDIDNSGIFYRPSKCFDGNTSFRHKKLLPIYESIGVWFYPTPLDDIGQLYSYTTTYNGETISGTLDQRHHYCQLNSVEPFGGLVIPRIDRKTGETTLEIGQIIGSTYF